MPLPTFLAHSLAEFDLDPEVYAEYLVGILQTSESVDDAVDCVKDASPRCTPAALESFRAGLAEVWDAHKAALRIDAQQEQSRRALEVAQSLDVLHKAAIAGPAAEAGQAKASMLTAEEKLAILQNHALERAPDESMDEKSGHGSQANRERVVQERKQELQFRAEDAKKLGNQSRQAADADRKAREAAKLARQQRAGKTERKR
jgi:hypothetical protein